MILQVQFFGKEKVTYTHASIRKFQDKAVSNKDIEHKVGMVTEWK
jgi:hypothetical protein